MSQNNKMILGAKEKPSGGKWFVLSLQHVFAMFGATILVPMLTDLPVSVALFSSGVGTLIYILCTKAKVPVYLGSSFAFITPIALISSKAGLGGIFSGLFIVGIVYVVVALIIKFIGTKWIDKLLPPIIIGPMIAIIGFGLAGNAVNDAGLLMQSSNELGESLKIIAVSLTSLLIVSLIALRGKGFIKIIPFILGIVGGYALAAVLGLVDFTKIGEVAKSPVDWLKLPEFTFLWFKDKSFTFLGSEMSLYKFNFAAGLTMIPVAFVTISEHIGDHAVLSEITGEDFLHDPGLDKTIMGDGLATMFASLVGGPANTTYGENTSVVGMTKIGSVWVTGLAAVIAICLSFFNIFIVIIDSIPAAVMGGISIILYGFIGMNGIKVLIDNKVDFSKTRNTIIASTILVLGLGGALINFGEFQFEGMALAAIVGIILNLALPQERPISTDL